MSKNDIAAKKCMTPKFRVSFPHVFEAHSGFKNQEPKYSVVMLFDKSTDLKDLKRAAHNAAVEKFGADNSKWPRGFDMPFRDGDDKEDLQGYAGCYYINAKSKQRPGVIDSKKSPITKEDQSFYAGCYARATLIAFAYQKGKNAGVAFALQNLQKLDDGQPFSGRRRAEDEFDSVSDASDDTSSYGEDDGLPF